MSEQQNALVAFDQAPLPAHVQAFFQSDEGSNIEARTTVNSLSPQGKQWTISLNGDRTVLTRRNQDGDVEPLNIMRVIVLDFAKRRGRSYYEGAYDPGNEAPPVCWSDDGVAPPANVPKRQSEKCEGCPMAVKGSKIAEGGRAVTACSQHRMLAVIPAHKPDFPPLRLKIAITSDWDKQSPDAQAAGWYAFQNYMDYLRSKGVTHSAAVVTKMKFDQDAAYPKIFFAAERWLTPEELSVIAPRTKDDEVQQLLGGTWTPAGADGVKQETVQTQQPAQTQQTQQQVEPESERLMREAAAAAAQQKAVETPAQKALREAQEALAREEAAAAAAAAQQPAKAFASGDDGEIMGLDAPASTPAQQPAQTQQPVATPQPTATQQAATGAAQTAQQPVKAIDPSVASLLAEWGEG